MCLFRWEEKIKFKTNKNLGSADASTLHAQRSQSVKSEGGDQYEQNLQSGVEQSETLLCGDQRAGKTADQRMRRPQLTDGDCLFECGGLFVVLWGSAPDFWRVGGGSGISRLCE